MVCPQTGDRGWKPAPRPEDRARCGRGAGWMAPTDRPRTTAASSASLLIGLIVEEDQFAHADSIIVARNITDPRREATAHPRYRHRPTGKVLERNADPRPGLGALSLLAHHLSLRRVRGEKDRKFNGSCNGYCCVGRAGTCGRWLGGPGGFRADPARVSRGCRGCGVTDSEGPVLGRESIGAGQVTLTGRKRPSGKALTSSPADRTHKRERVRSLMVKASISRGS